MTEEAVLEVDLPAQMVRAISDLDCWWSLLISHLHGQISCEEISHLLLWEGAAVSTHFTDLSVLEGGLLQYQLLATPLTRKSFLQKDLKEQVISPEVFPTNGETEIVMQILCTSLC